MTPQLQQLLDLCYQSRVLKNGDYPTTLSSVQDQLGADPTLMAEAQSELARLNALDAHLMNDLRRRDYVQDVYRGALAAALNP